MKDNKKKSILDISKLNQHPKQVLESESKTGGKVGRKPVNKKDWVKANIELDPDLKAKAQMLGFKRKTTLSTILNSALEQYFQSKKVIKELEH